MSYDIRISKKIKGGEYAVIAEPEYSSPTYNLRDMFVNCMGWDYSQGEKYPASLALCRIELGIVELICNRKHYEKYNPPNGWGDIDSAIRALESSRYCIRSAAKDYPIEALYFEW